MAAFLAGLPAGSVVADVGCGNGRYLASARPDVVVLGLDRCAGVGGGGARGFDNLRVTRTGVSFAVSESCPHYGSAARPVSGSLPRRRRC